MNESTRSTEKANAESRDWEILRASRPEDYVGATGFEQMNALQRLRWLDLAVDFVARQKIPPRVRPGDEQTS